MDPKDANLGMLDDLRRLHPRVSHLQGPFALLESAARNSSFVLAPVLRETYGSPSEKLSSAVSIALAYGLVLITEARVLTGLGLPGVPYGVSPAPEFASAFSMTDADLLHARAEMLRWRDAHFARAIASIKRRLLRTAQSESRIGSMHNGCC